MDDLTGKIFRFYSTLVGMPLKCLDYRNDKIRYRFQQDQDGYGVENRL